MVFSFDKFLALCLACCDIKPQHLATQTISMILMNLNTISCCIPKEH